MSSDPNDDDGDYGDPNDPCHGDFGRWIVIELEQAQSPKVFHEALLRAIRYPHAVTDDEREEILEAAAKPWKKPPKSKQKEYARIFHKYILSTGERMADGEPRPTRADAIRQIVQERHPKGFHRHEFALEEAALSLAGKDYNAALKGGWMPAEYRPKAVKGKN